MFEIFDIDIFNDHVNNHNFIEIGMINRCKDFKELRIYLGKKYNDIFILFDDKAYIKKEKNVKVQDTISFFYEIDKDKIMLSTYVCEYEKKINNLSKVLKWTWKDWKRFSKYLRVDFLHF
jgi:hypothetical protein